MNVTKRVLPALALALVCATSRAEDTNILKGPLEKNSYAIGMSFGNNLKQGEVEVDWELLIRAMKETTSGQPTLLTPEEMQQTLMKLGSEIRAKMAEKQRKVGEKNKADADTFLAANKNKPGVISLPNGLQYKVIAEGNGESPKPEDIITAHYRGTLIDGTEFDASKPDAPLSRAANQVIRGWTEALTRMKPGAKWQLFIPPDLGYGERGFPPKIGPNCALIFDIELVSFKSSPPPVAPTPPQPLTSDIIKVPSREEMEKGAKIETIKAEDVERLQREAEAQRKAAETKKP